MDTKSAGILGGCIIVAALVVSLVPGLMTGAPGAVRSIHSADGRLEVGYMTTREVSTMGRVTDIEFCPNYVVVKTQDGHGRVFFTEHTQMLDWSLRPPPPPFGTVAKEPTTPTQAPRTP